ncbi:MAG: tripartite tricarboxylate transporter substrate binding protein [Burkholderiaceae bacterium]
MTATLNAKKITACFRRRQFLGIGLSASLFMSKTWSQTDWPTRGLKVIVPFSAGGAADTSARAVSKRVSEILGQQITIDNRTGGNALVAAGVVLAAPKDGYTFIWDAANQLTNPVLVKDIPFDYRNAFTPVTMAVRAPQALLVRQDFPAKNLEEFIELAKSKPASISCGTPPAGGMGHLALALLQQRSGIKLIHTPYRGGADAARDLMGGQIDAGLFTTSTARNPVATGKARMLAVTSASRVPAYADVPTIAERGFAGYDMDDWFALFAATGTPDSAIERLQAAVTQAAKDPQLTTLLAPLGIVLVANSSAEFANWLARQRELLQRLIRDSNIALT